MPFLRPMTVRTVTFAVATLLVLTSAGPTPATAVLDPAAVHTVADPATASDASTTPDGSADADASVRCPEPVRTTWHEHRGPRGRGCVELYLTTMRDDMRDEARDDAREDDAPVTLDELARLNLGDLPAWATVDIDAITASLAAFEQHLADEAAAREATEREAAARAAREAAAREAARRTPTTSARAPQATWGPGFAPWESGRSAADKLAERENAAYEACLEQLGDLSDHTDRDVTRAYFDTHARCVDAQVPGYYARWVEDQARRDAAFEEGMREERAARARLAERRERALQEIRDTCPYGGFAAPTQYYVSSYDDVHYVVTCYDSPNG